jgi:D-inositol-3-phosphate glycosyltransferase
VRSLAVLSMHTSPLTQPGFGDGGGMNVYVRELSTALARAGVACKVFTRAWRPDQPEVVDVEPGLKVHHVAAGPSTPVPKEALPDLVPEFTEGVFSRLVSMAAEGDQVDAIHANYWLSGIAGHKLKHELELPLISTFHTLDRVKAEASPEEISAEEPARRAQAEAETIGCSDAILASCGVEVDQLVGLYGAAESRIEIVAPGVEHAFFSPGERRQARRALGLPVEASILLFVGRIQPLKGLDVAVCALSELLSMARTHPGGERLAESRLVVVGGPSGPRGYEEMARIAGLVSQLGLGERVRFLPPQRHEMLSTIYRAADVCVVPSRSESFGLVALEAAACGIPVVASAVGGLITLVEDGRTGFLVDDRDARTYALRIAEILTDEELALDMSTSGARAAGAYTWSTAAARVRRLYRDLTARELVECT